MKVTIIQPRSFPEMPEPKFVAAYCRVSTIQEIQLHSLKAQKDYYKKLILSKPGWFFVGIYADEASGRHNLKMKNFQAMLNDCREGKINLILVKSISRMGRNTLQFLQACDELNALKVDVYFEIEKLHISNPKTVQIMTIYANPKALPCDGDTWFDFKTVRPVLRHAGVTDTERQDWENSYPTRRKPDRRADLSMARLRRFSA